MNVDFTIAKGNRLPSISDALLDADDNPIPLTVGGGVSGVKFSMWDYATGTLQIDNADALVLDDGTAGLVRYDWTVDDAELPAGFYYARWKIEYSSARSLDVPNEGQIVVEITEAGS